MFASVDMASEIRSLFLELAVGREGKDLEPSGIGEDRPVPAVEAVKPSGITDDIHAGPQV